ncbi:hypothetical protein LSAT2_001415 [Lamellibrachia satsuma]|nr:hypothetical protein LSAT2_001415 [Lamellibrachia satsuma]
MYRLWRLALTLFTLKIQSGVMADFVVTADTNSITVTWDDTRISGLSVFTISLDDELKFSGDDTAKPPVIINGLQSGTTHHLVINTTTHGNTKIVVDEHKTTRTYSTERLDDTNTISSGADRRYRKRKNYNDAKAACEATDDGHLVTVDSEGVQRVLKTLMDRSNVTKAWLGAKRTKTDWRWVGSGKSLKYQGCFSDTGDARLSVSVSSKHYNTPDSCIAECRHRNNKYAGVKRDSNVEHALPFYNFYEANIIVLQVVANLTSAFFSVFAVFPVFSVFVVFSVFAVFAVFSVSFRSSSC